MRQLTFGSLFAGIGGADLGFERAGMKCKWQVEIEPNCHLVLAKNFPDVKRYTDITKIGDDELEKVDVIVGGFPCQDVSSAGLRKGVNEGKRSSLFREAIRIARALQPHYLVFENVAGLLNLGMGTVLTELSEIGFDAEWEVVPASSVGAPHRRERVFIVAYPANHGRHFSAVFDRRPEASGDWQAAPERAPLDLAYWQAVLPARVFGVPDGVPSRVDRVRAKMLGNAIVPQVAEYIGRCIVAHYERTIAAC